MIVLFAIYAALGLIVAVAFVCAGLARVMPHGATATPGARLVLIPGAFALWPYVLFRWLTSGPRR